MDRERDKMREVFEGETEEGGREGKENETDREITKENER